MNVANTRARQLVLHFCSNKITGSGAGTLVEQIAKSSANKKADEAMRVPSLTEIVNERAQAQQIDDVSSARFTKLSSAIPSLVIPPKDGWGNNEEAAQAEAAKDEAAEAKAVKEAGAGGAVRIPYLIGMVNERA